MTAASQLAVALGATIACAGSRVVREDPGATKRDGSAAGDDSLEADEMKAATRMSGDSESTFGPLDVGERYRSYRRITDKPFLSLVHGNRWVDVYVNELGAGAYLQNTPIPVGTIIVKESWIDRGGAPSSIRGPIYVMEKRGDGYAPDHGNWYYAIHWAQPAAEFGGPIYWRGRSPRVEFCYDCHDAYDRGLGGLVPSSLVPR